MIHSRILAVAVLICACASASQAEAPKATATAEPLAIKINGPTDPIAPGLPVFLACEGVKKGDPYSLFMIPANDGQFLVLFDDTSKPVGIFSNTKQGVYSAVLVAYDPESKSIARYVFAVTIGQKPPDPPNPPNPPNPPVVPDGKLGFTKLAFEQGSQVAPSFRSQAAAIADNFDGTAAAIAAGTLRTIEAANAEMVAKNRATIGDAGRSAWLPFFTAWQSAADAALKAGTLKANLDDYAAIYRATADGLRRIR